MKGTIIKGLVVGISILPCTALRADDEASAASSLESARYADFKAFSSLDANVIIDLQNKIQLSYKNGEGYIKQPALLLSTLKSQKIATVMAANQHYYFLAFLQHLQFDLDKPTKKRNETMTNCDIIQYIRETGKRGNLISYPFLTMKEGA